MRATSSVFAAGALFVALFTIQSPASAQTYYSDPAPRYYADPGSPSRHPAFSNVAPRQDAIEEPGSKSGLPAHLRRQIVSYETSEPAGTIVIDTPNTYLYYVLGGGKAVRYGIGVGRDGFRWSGVQHVGRKAEWPDWNPPAEMIARQPYLPRFMAGGPTNPLGARAMYLGNTIYRIHGTNAPSTIGSRVSSGCIRLTNEDVIDLYGRVKIGAKVVVMPDRGRAPTMVKRGNPQNASRIETREPMRIVPRAATLTEASSVDRSAPQAAPAKPATVQPASAGATLPAAPIAPAKPKHPIQNIRI